MAASIWNVSVPACYPRTVTAPLADWDRVCYVATLHSRAARIIGAYPVASQSAALDALIGQDVEPDGEPAIRDRMW